MTTTRLDIRLDASHRQKLEVVAAQKGEPLATVVRGLIDRAYQELRRAQRLEAAQRIAQVCIEAVPDPEVLARELADTYALPDLS